jgi:hypothetical protein
MQDDACRPHEGRRGYLPGSYELESEDLSLAEPLHPARQLSLPLSHVPVLLQSPLWDVLPLAQSAPLTAHSDGVIPDIHKGSNHGMSSMCPCPMLMSPELHHVVH